MNNSIMRDKKHIRLYNRQPENYPKPSAREFPYPETIEISLNLTSKEHGSKEQRARAVV